MIRYGICVLLFVLNCSYSLAAGYVIESPKECGFLDEDLDVQGATVTTSAEQNTPDELMLMDELDNMAASRTSNDYKQLRKLATTKRSKSDKLFSVKLDGMPPEVVFEILKYLTTKDRKKLGLSCKKLNFFVNSYDRIFYRQFVNSKKQGMFRNVLGYFGMRQAEKKATLKQIGESIRESGSIKALNVYNCDAVRNNFDGFCLIIQRLKNLEALNLTGVVPNSGRRIAFLSRTIKDNFAYFRHLDLSNNDFSSCEGQDESGTDALGAVYKMIADCNIKSLILANCKFDKPMFASLGLSIASISDFQYLDLSGIVLDFDNISDLTGAFSSMKGLHTLSLRNSIKDAKILELLLKDLPKLKPLKHLDLSNNSFKSLRGVGYYLSGNNIVHKKVDLVAALIKKLNLNSINLSGCNLTEFEINRFLEKANSKTLLEIDLSYNELKRQFLINNLSRFAGIFPKVRHMKVSVKSRIKGRKLSKVTKNLEKRKLFVDIRLAK